MIFSKEVAATFRLAILRELSEWLEMDDDCHMNGDLEREAFAVSLAAELLESIRKTSASEP